MYLIECLEVGPQVLYWAHISNVLPTYVFI